MQMLQRLRDVLHYNTGVHKKRKATGIVNGGGEEASTIPLGWQTIAINATKSKQAMVKMQIGWRRGRVSFGGWLVGCLGSWVDAKGVRSCNKAAQKSLQNALGALFSFSAVHVYWDVHSWATLLRPMLVREWPRGVQYPVRIISSLPVLVCGRNHCRMQICTTGRRDWDGTIKGHCGAELVIIKRQCGKE